MSLVTDYIKHSFGIKLVELHAYGERLSLEAVQEMQSEQAGDKYWNNETLQAVQGLFQRAFRDAEYVGFELWHKMDYGVFLELANNRQNAILLPKAEKFAKLYMDYAQGLFA